MKIEIQPDKFYSAKSVVDMGILPCKSRKTFCMLLRTKKWAKVFNVIEHKGPKTSRFYIKGANIIKYITLRDNGEFGIKQPKPYKSIYE